MKSFWKIWFFSLFIKLFISAILPLGADEAYYWVWSKNLQLSYYDHPAMIAWIFKAGEFFEPLLNAVRWPGVFLGHLTLAVWYLLLKRYFTFDKLYVWVLLTLFSPLLGFGSIILTPDLPVLFFWSLAIFFTIRALEQKKSFYYLMVGAALGLGFCSKYHIVLFVPCLLLYLQLEKKWRDVTWKYVPLTVFTGLLCSLPVIIWNFQNNFASIEFQLKHGLEKSQYELIWTSSYLIGEVLLVFPLMFWAAIKATPPHDLRWLKYFGWTPLVFFFFTSFRASTELNWPIIGFPAILALAVFYSQTISWSKYYVAFWGFFFALVVGSVVIPTFRQIHGKLEEPYQMKELSPLIIQYQPLYADSYQAASSLWYLNKSPIYKLKDMSRHDFFDSLSQSIPTEGRFFLLQKKDNSLPAWMSESNWSVKKINTFFDQYLLLEFTRK